MKASLFVFFTLSFLALVSDLAGVPALIAPFGATVVILFQFPAGPFSAPRSYLGGHALAAVVGLVCQHLIPHQALAIGVAGGLSLYLMRVTRTIHPAAGATPLVILLTHQTWEFLLYPLGLGLVVIAAVFEIFGRKLLRS